MSQSNDDVKLTFSEAFDQDLSDQTLNQKSKTCLRSVVCNSIKVISLILFFLVFVAPVIYKSSYTVQKVFLFLNFVKWPPNLNLTNPSEVGLEGARNLYLSGEDNVKLGVWHILPESLVKEAKERNAGEEQFNAWLKDGRPVIVYAHGNSGHRGAGHRVQLYHVLQKSNFHVIAFDYRGYGDSSDVPIDETGLVQDTLTVYKWVKSQTKENVFMWGHSLGTGITSHAVKILHIENNEPEGLILEAPFNNIIDEVREHPFAKFYSLFPWFDYFFTTPMYENGLRFESDKNLLNASTPILILHAKDDKIVPYHLGLKLYKDVLAYRQSINASDRITEMKSYEADKHFGHKFICEAPDLATTIQDFIKKSLAKPNAT